MANHKVSSGSIENIPWKICVPVVVMVALLLLANVFSGGSRRSEERAAAGYWPGGKSLDNAIEVMDNTSDVVVGASRVLKKGADVFLKRTEQVLDKRQSSPQ